MNITQKFNALNGVRVSRSELKNLVQEAKNQNNTEIIYRISKVLNAHPEAEYFELEIQQYPTQTGLGAARHLGNYKEALDDCGRLKKGWKFVNGSVVKVEKKEKKSSKTSPKKEEKTEKITKKTEKSPSDNRPLLEKSLDELYTQFAGPHHAPRQQFYKDISEKFGVHKLVAYVFVNTIGIKNYWLVTKNDFPMAQKVFKDFDKFFSKKKSEGAFFKLEFTDFSKEILAWIEKRKNWKKYWIPTDENYLSAPDGLYGLEYIPYNEQTDELLGLGKAVSPEQIYKMITQKVIESMKKATGKGYVKKWKTKNAGGFFVPVNFATKKAYRGINFLMLKTRLKEGVFGVFENPYFLTFNQIKERNGKLKKGAKGYEVIYFSFHYKVFSNKTERKKYFLNRLILMK